MDLGIMYNFDSEITVPNFSEKTVSQNVEKIINLWKVC